MTDVMSMLKNPVVIIGGVLIGGVILLTQSSGANAATASSVSAVNPAVLSASTAMNTAAMGAQIQMAQIQATLGAQQLSADVQKQANFFAFLANADNNNAVLAGKQIESQAGIANNLITTNAAMTIDFANNSNRLALAYVDANKAAHTDDANVSIARLQADAQKSASKNNMIGQVAGGLFNAIGHAVPFL